MSSHQPIPRLHWVRYLKAVSRYFAEQPAWVALERAGEAPRPIADGLDFQGIALEGGHRPAVMIAVARLGHPEMHFAHRVPDPTLIVRELDAEGRLTRLIIEDSARIRTTLSFQDPAPAPGARHYHARVTTERCDHPRCPVSAI